MASISPRGWSKIEEIDSANYSLATKCVGNGWLQRSRNFVGTEMCGVLRVD